MEVKQSHSPKAHIILIIVKFDRRLIFISENMTQHFSTGEKGHLQINRNYRENIGYREAKRKKHVD